MKTVKKYAPYIVQEMIYIESYLEEMAAKGLLLKKWNVFCAEFEQGEPRKLRYRVVPKAVDAEEKQIFRGSGWEYVCSKGWADQFSVFCTDDETAPELFTDMGSYKIYMKKFKRSCFWNIILIPVLLLLWSKNIMSDYYYLGGPMHDITDFGIAPCLFIIMCLVWWFAMLVWNLRALIKIRKGASIKRDGSYKRALRNHKIIETLFFITAIAALVVLISNVSNIDLGSSREDVAQPLSVREIDENAWSHIKYAIDNNDWSEHDLFYETESSRDVWKNSTYIYADTSDVAYRASYHEFSLESMAEKWLKEEIAYDVYMDLEYGSEDIPQIKIDVLDEKIIWNLGIEEMIEMESEKVDYMGYYEVEGSQNLYLRNDNRIEIISYNGEKDVLENIDLFINDLNE